MKHPNVVEVFNADQVGETHYYEMEYVDGTDLTKLVRDRGALPVPEACEYIRQAALGLHHAFEKGLVHRDIKPSNILVSRVGNVVKLVDLGLARIMENEQAAREAGRVTQEGFVIGTPDFLAPEQARNPMAVDIRADIYALGGTLYFLLTGKVPYEGSNPTEKLLKHCTEPPPGLLLQRMDAPPRVEQLIHWCMAKRAEARPQTPMQLALALQPFCPVPAAGRPQAPVAARIAAPPPAAMPLLNYPTPTEGDSQRSSVVFRLPPQTTSADPIRRRSEASFPWGITLVGLGALLVVAILGYGIYIGFVRPGEPPIESFTTSQNTGSIKMLKLDGGKFRMGSPETEPGRKADEGPQREVTISGPFLISEAEITHTQFLKVMGTSPTKSAASANRASTGPLSGSRGTRPTTSARSWPRRRRSNRGPARVGRSACRRRPSGNTRRAVGPRRRSYSANRFFSRSKGCSGRPRRTRCGRCRSTAIRPRSRKTRASRSKSARPRRTSSVCSTCTATWPNGALTGTNRAIPTPPARTPPGRATATNG